MYFYITPLSLDVYFQANQLWRHQVQPPISWVTQRKWFVANGQSITSLIAFTTFPFRQNVGYIHTERMAPKHLETVLTAKIIATIINEPPFCGVLKFLLQICALPTTSRTLWPYWILVLYEITSKSMQCNIIAHISQDRHNRRWRNFLKPAFFLV